MDYGIILDGMKKIRQILKKRNHVVFFDLEGTSRSQEMIAIGAVLVTLKKDLTIKKMKHTFYRLVKAKNPIGRYVVNLTGITEDMLKEKGVSFLEAMKDFKKYLGVHYKDSLFVTFGNNDIRILNQSVSYNLDAPVEIIEQIKKNYWDFAGFMNAFVKDDRGQQLSLVNFCAKYEVQEAGKAHDPVVDSLNLANLYNAFILRKDLDTEEYTKTIYRGSHYPAPLVRLLQKLKEGPVTYEDFEEEVRKEFD